MKKRILACLLASVILATVFAGCNAADNTSTDSQQESVPVEEQMADFDGEVDLEPVDEAPVEVPGVTVGSAVDVIMNAYSAKSFAEQPVSQETLDYILQSGVKAPSARNSQPWHFTVVTNGEQAAELVSQAVEGTVPIVVSAQTDPGEGIDSVFDCALATENMYIAAQSMGLGAHIYMGGVANLDRQALEIPDGFDPVAILLIGYVEDAQDAISSASTRDDMADKVNYID